MTRGTEAVVRPVRAPIELLSAERAGARFAAWPLWVGFWCAARMRCGLALAGAQRGFQFPAQTFGFLFQPLDLFAQPLVFLLRSIQISFRNKLDALRLLIYGGSADRSHPTLR